MMSVLCHAPTHYVLYAKGAPESVLARCTHALADDGSEVALSEALREDMTKRVSGKPTPLHHMTWCHVTSRHTADTTCHLVPAAGLEVGVMCV